VTTAALAINETLHKNKGFAADDFTTVARDFPDGVEHQLGADAARKNGALHH
jgi:hypothetical protein